jgi:hypothetical protein
LRTGGPPALPAISVGALILLFFFICAKKLAKVCSQLGQSWVAFIVVLWVDRGSFLNHQFETVPQLCTHGSVFLPQ